MEKPMLYACDPEKKIVCAKTICKYNPNAKYHDCACTTHSEFAKLDQTGRPMIDRKAMGITIQALWNKVANEIRYGLYCVRRELFNFLNRFRC